MAGQAFAASELLHSPPTDTLVHICKASRLVFFKNFCMVSYVYYYMWHYVYILQSQKDKKMYIGYTSNLERRLQEHANGLVPSTSWRRPLICIHYETYLSQKDALRREAGQSHLKQNGFILPPSARWAPSPPSWGRHILLVSLPHEDGEGLGVGVTLANAIALYIGPGQ